MSPRLHRLREALRDVDQQNSTGLLPGAVVKMNQPIAFTQPIESDASPPSQFVTTNLIVLDFEPDEAKAVSDESCQRYTTSKTKVMGR
jgi:hypothetical protein